MVNLIDTPHLDQIRKFKVLFARYQRSRDLISVGAYAPGSDPVLDQAIALYPQMESFLQQQLIEQSNFPSSLEALKALI
jgi:flagellum-specific ATP synthase